MKLSEKLLTVANWLESDENDLMLNADSDEQLNVVASALVKAAEALREGSEEVSKTEEDMLTPEKLDEMAAVAKAFDESDDDLLKKQASVLDEILLTLAAPKNAIAQAKKAEDDRIEELKVKYKGVKEDLDKSNKIVDAEKALKKSPYMKEVRPLEFPLSTRTCFDHPGSQLQRVGEHTWKCSLDNKIYNYDTGFSDLKGNKIPGGGVEYQIPLSHDTSHNVFDVSDTRSDRLGMK